MTSSSGLRTTTAGSDGRSLGRRATTTTLPSGPDRPSAKRRDCGSARRFLRAMAANSSRHPQPLIASTDTSAARRQTQAPRQQQVQCAAGGGHRDGGTRTICWAQLADSRRSGERRMDRRNPTRSGSHRCRQRRTSSRARPPHAEVCREGGQTVTIPVAPRTVRARSTGARGGRAVPGCATLTTCRAASGRCYLPRSRWLILR